MISLFGAHFFICKTASVTKWVSVNHNVERSSINVRIDHTKTFTKHYLLLPHFELTTENLEHWHRIGLVSG